MRALTRKDRYCLRLFRKEFGGYYVKVRTYALWGFEFWETDLASEEYPAWADIDCGALGYTDWKPSI